jgi:hypothetical protein
MTANRSNVAQPVDVDTETLRNAIKDEYKEVAEHPGKGFHFHTGRRLTNIVGYKEATRTSGSTAFRNWPSNHSPVPATPSPWAT